MSEEKIQIEFTPEPGAPSPVPVKIDEAEEKKAKAKLALLRRKEALALQLAEAKIYEKLGAVILHVGARTLRKIGNDVAGLGIKNIGHGKIFVAGHDALINSMARCDALIDKYMASDPPTDPDCIVGVLQMKLGFTKLLLESGEADIRSVKQADAGPEAPHLKIPFPPGKSMAVLVGSPPAQITLPQ